jgi:hypothetical protein
MPKFPKHWYGKSGKAQMCHGKPPNGQPQDFYFPDKHPSMPGYFKGMQFIFQERGLVEESQLKAECLGFKCQDLKASCCCWWVLFNQTDFIAQKPALFELVEAHGHIAFFYPKFHCELNFIEQCWGACYIRIHIRGSRPDLIQDESRLSRIIGPDPHLQPSCRFPCAREPDPDI